MYFTNAIVLALSVVGLTSAAPLQKRACAPLELVFARGTGDPGIVGPPLYSSLKRLVPQASYKNVDYPAAIPFLASAAMGSSSMKNHIEARNRECPQMKFALSGYSQGVMVIHGMTLNAQAKAQVVAIATFGDPYKIIQAMAPWPINDKTGVLDKCAAGDPICAGGFNILAHMGYGMDTGPAARHIANKFNAGGASAIAGGAATGGLSGLLGGLTGAAPAAPAASPAAPAAGGLSGLLGGLTGGAAAAPAAPAAPAAGGLSGLLGGLTGGAAAAPAAPAAPAASPAAGGLSGLLGGLGGGGAAEPASGGLGGLFGK